MEENEQENNNTSEDKLEASSTISWVSPEYYSGDKNKMWYVWFTIIVLIMIAISVLLIKSWSFAILILIMATSLVIYSKRPPQEIKYTLSMKQGLYVGETLYNLQDYKSFKLIRDGGRNSVFLVPIKRFSPGISVYFPEESGERIIDILASRLPMEESSPDIMDKIISKLKI